MNLVILGPQGSGKGTQAELLTKRYGFSHIETGEILRKIADSDHPWGGKIKKMMLRGELVSDDVLMTVLKECLKEPAKNGYLFDGTPRNMSQYGSITEILATYGQIIDKVVLINISEQETIRRLSSRRTCQSCGRIYNLITNPSPAKNKCECGGLLVQREDDVPSSIKKRLQSYLESTSKVVEIARNEGKLTEINGEQPIEQIHEEIVRKLGLEQK